MTFWSFSIFVCVFFVLKFTGNCVEEPYWGLAGSSNKQQDRRVLVQ